MAWKGTKKFTRISKYNFGDTNRENENVQFLYDKLRGMGYPVELSKPVVIAYDRTHFPTVSAIKNLRQNIKDLITGFYPVDAPIIVVSNDRLQQFGYLDANAIELNLEAINKLSESIIQSFKYSGTFSAGETDVL